MKPNTRLFDEVDLQVSSRIPTDAERIEMSAFIKELKRKEKLKVQRKAAKKNQTAKVWAFTYIAFTQIIL